MTPRFYDWNTRLYQYLNASFNKSFEYGSMDCVLFASGAVKAMTGVGFAEEGRGKYTTLAGGLKHVKMAGYADHFVAVRSLFAPIETAFANVGDLAIVDDGESRGLGIVQGELIYVMTPDGFGTVPREFMKEAFTV